MRQGDKTVLAIGLGSGGSLLLILLIAIVFIVLWKTGYIARKMKERDEAFAAEVEMMAFTKCNVSVEHLPNTITFEGQQPILGEEVKEEMTIKNNGENNVIVAFNENKENDE